MEFIIRRTSEELDKKTIDKAYKKGNEWHINIKGGGIDRFFFITI